MAPEIVE
jgi:serine/threonine protein kinase